MVSTLNGNFLVAAFIFLVLLTEWSVKGSRVKGGSHSSSRQVRNQGSHGGGYEEYKQQSADLCPTLNPPTNGRISCYTSSGTNRCTSNCVTGYHFPDRSTTVDLTCLFEEGIWFPETKFDHCIDGSADRYVNLEGQQQQQQHYQDEYRDSHAEYEEQQQRYPTVDLCPKLRPPMNGRFACQTSEGTTKCTSHCMDGYHFPDGSRTAERTCLAHEGVWMPFSYFDNCIAYSVRSCNQPTSIVNGAMHCSGDNYKMTCQGTCNPGYEFPDRSRQKTITCSKSDGIWLPNSFFEDCQLLCHPPCENGGTCSTLNQCICTVSHRGNRCQYAKALCDFNRFSSGMVTYECNHNPEYTECYVACPAGMVFHPPSTNQYRCTVNGLWNPPHPPTCARGTSCSKPPTPMNGQLSCSGNNEMLMCKAKCMNGYLFPSGFPEMVIQCSYVSGQWTPEVNFPDCDPVCNPQCSNGGRCVGHNQCICPSEYRGSRCEYPISNCNVQEFLASVASSCRIGAEETVCQVSCGQYTRALEPPAPNVYVCGLDGQWVPNIKPECKSDYKIDLRTDTNEGYSSNHGYSGSHSYQQQHRYESQSRSEGWSQFEGQQRHDMSQMSGGWSTGQQRFGQGGQHGSQFDGQQRQNEDWEHIRGDESSNQFHNKETGGFSQSRDNQEWTRFQNQQTANQNSVGHNRGRGSHIGQESLNNNDFEFTDQRIEPNQDQVDVVETELDENPYQWQQKDQVDVMVSRDDPFDQSQGNEIRDNQRRTKTNFREVDEPIVTKKKAYETENDIGPSHPVDEIETMPEPQREIEREWEGDEFEVASSYRGVCSVWGFPHYRTFDGALYSFPGTCIYTLVSDCDKKDFQVLFQQNCHRKLSNGTSSLCSQELEIKLHNQRYHLSPANGLSHDGVRLPIPIVTNGLSVEKISIYLVVRFSPGISVWMSYEGALHVTATQKQGGKYCGLCGNFDGDPSNDIISPQGDRMPSIAAFGNSWKTRDSNDDCVDAEPYFKACSSETSERRYAAEKSTLICATINSMEYKECHKLVDPTVYHRKCEMDCCSDNVHPGCECNSFSEYFLECARAGGDTSHGWRTPALCPLSCVNGTAYNECGPTCVSTCGNSEPVCKHEKCVDGCHCPSGNVMETGHCIPVQDCPCTYGNRRFASGETMTSDCNTCLCQGGQWLCTEEVCPATCTVSGSHYTTFDGVQYDLRTKCPHYLIDSKELRQGFSITVDYSATCGDYASLTGSGCIKSLTIHSPEGAVVKVKHDFDVSVNGKEVSSLPVAAPGVYVGEATSMFIKIQLENGLKLLWDGHERILVHAPVNLFGHTRGLCGTYSRNQADEFLTPEDDIELTCDVFSEQWKTDEKCPDYQPALENSCDKSSIKRETAIKMCTIFRENIFEECHSYVDPDPYETACSSDICNCDVDATSCLCGAIANYATACSRKGIHLQWRKFASECMVHCEIKGQIYHPCAGTCSYSCSDISRNEGDCNDICVEGCVCPSGQTVDHHLQKCVPISTCSCQHSGHVYPPEFLQRRGKEMCECSEALWNCREASPTEIILTPPPHIAPTCSAVHHQEPTTCMSSCPFTCSNLHHHQPCTVVTCEPGCQCEENHVLHVASGICMLPSECPCHHGGNTYEAGTKIKMDCNSCVCYSGQWQCESNPCPGLCTVWGNSHYRTFDGRAFDFKGECDYVLTRGHVNDDVIVSVVIQNALCGTMGVTCGKSVTVTIGEDSLTLSQFDPMPQHESESNLKISQLGMFILVDTDVGISVHWDRGTRVYVIAQPVWKGKLKGLCGDFNSDSTDDFKPPSGGIPLALPQDFANSWRVQEYCQPASTLSDTCTEKPERLQWAKDKCAILKSPLFEPCHHQVEVEDYHRRCLFDSCACDSGGDCECFCAVVAAYTHECARHDVIIAWRSQDLCPIQCEECDSYSPCISLCPDPHCENIETEEIEPCRMEPCVEGCVRKPCQPGYIHINARNHTCIPEEDCPLKPCAVINGITYREGQKIDDSTVGDACQSCYCRHGLPDCVGVPCTVAPTIPTLALKLENCELNGWTDWINSIHPLDNGGSDVENVESLVTSRRIPCSKIHITSIQCRDAETQAPLNTTGDDVICNLESGLSCKGGSFWRRCPDYEVRVYCACGEQEPCPPGETLKNCAFKCDSVCNSLLHDLRQKGRCDIKAECIEACTKNTCDPPYVSRDSDTCVLPEMCTCRLESGYLLAPGEVITNGCEKCQCLNNTLLCSTLNECMTTDEEEERAMIIVPHRTTVLNFEEEERRIFPVPVATESVVVLPLTKTPTERPFTVTTTRAPSTQKISTTPTYGVVTTPVACTHWSDWINKGKPKRKRGDREDTLPFALRQTEGFCMRGRVSEIECRDAVTDTLYTETGELKLTCNLHSGFICNNHDQPDKKCRDYKIRYYCDCENEETTEIFLKPTTPSYIYPCTEFVPLINGISPLADSQIKASSSVSSSSGPQNVRLTKTTRKGARGTAWSPAIADENQFIEVDLQNVTAIYGVITKGKTGANEWVTSYRLLYSRDGISYSYYSDNKDKPFVFSANYDDLSESKHILEYPFEARFVRLEPIGWENAISLQMDLYGCAEAIQSTTPIPWEYVTSIKPPMQRCTDPMGLESGYVSDLQLSASSVLDELHTAKEARLGNENTWVPRVADDNQYLQIDFIDNKNLTGIISKGSETADQYVTTYVVAYSSDGINWNKITDESARLPKEFAANFDAHTPVKNLFPSTIRTRHLRIIPTRFKNFIALQIEVLGCFHVVSCRDPMGIANEIVSKHQLSASSQYNEVSAPSNSRLNSLHGWSPLRSRKGQYLQVDFLKPVNLTAIVTKGRYDYPKWVTFYQVAYSDDGIDFDKIKGQYGTVQEFSGNYDKDTPVTNLLPHGIRARFVRILPQRWKLAMGIRLEVLGCYEELVCMEPMGLENGLVANGQLSASSYKDSYSNAANTRINDARGWSAASLNGEQYLQMDFLAPREVSAIITKGNGYYPQWVTKYKVQYSNDTKDWTTLKDNHGNTKILVGNADQNSPVVNLLGNNPINAQYFKIIPVDYSNWISMRIEVLGCYHPYACQEPMGMENGMISNSQITASSSKATSLSPENARIDSDTAWSAAVLNEDQYLQVDLIESRNVTGLVTLGRNDALEWVISYYVGYTQDGQHWEVVTDDKGNIKTFQGNYDSDTAVTARLPETIIARQVRIVPVTYNNWMSMRLEILGCYYPTVCKDPMGLENGMITNSQITASSYYSDLTSPSNVRLGGDYAWAAEDIDSDQYLEVNFEKPVNISAIITKGKPGTDQFVKSYQLAYSIDGAHWIAEQDDFGEPREFAANGDAHSTAIAVLPETIEAVKLRIYPTDFNEWISMQLEILGCYHPQEILPEEEVLAMLPEAVSFAVECPDPEESERDLLSDAVITASSSAPNSDPYLVRIINAKTGRKGAAGSWVPDVRDLHPVLVVQFPDLRVLSAVKIQGRPDEEQWVKSFRIIVSKDNHTWFPVFGTNGNELLDGNRDQRQIVGHYFKNQVTAQFVKVLPETWHKWPSFRMELIGCQHLPGTTPLPVSTRANIILPPVMLCPELDPSYRDACPASCAAGLMCNGEQCVDPVDCVCMHNGETFKIGDRIEDENCVQCDCALGGHSICKKKTCPPCPQGRKKSWSNKCECECTLCEDDQVFCPSDGSCILAERWCDGIVDCPDDETNCYKATTQTEEIKAAAAVTTATTTVTPHTGNDTCEIVGPHLQTFDGQVINYDHCHHIAVKDILDNSFSVLIHKSCVDHGACLHWIDITTDGHDIKVTSDLDVRFDGHSYSSSQLILLNKNHGSNFTIEKVGENIVIRLLKKNIKISYDKTAHLRIQVSSVWQNKLSGLCGYYSGEARDDQKTPNGYLAYTSQEFGDSWSSGVHPKDCVPVVCVHEVMQKAMVACNHLKNSPFDQCASVIDIDSHLELCTSSVCECQQKKNSSDENCACDSYLPLVELCTKKLGPTALRNWRLKVGCAPHCPEGMFWTECGPSCQLTCDTPSLESQSTCTDECMPGCFCPDGLVMDGDKCIRPDQCCDKVCQGFGDPHLETFDGLFYQFRAEGTFLIAAAENYDFSIEAITLPCGVSNNNTCVVGMRVKHGGHVATARQSDMVVIDDLDVTIDNLPKTVGGLTVLGFPGHTFVFLIRKLSIEARFYGATSGFTLKLPSRKYFNRTIGLCGNCDDQVANELKDNPLSEFVCDHMTDGSLEDCKKSFVVMPEVVEFMHVCDNLKDHIFSSCNVLVDPKNYIQACSFDASNGLNEKESLCKVLRDYSRKCCQVGLTIDTWRAKFGCDVPCDEGLVFNECHSGCPQTCEARDNATLVPNCADMKIDGCFCPEGTIFRDGTCISPIHCDACDEEGHLPLDIWQESPCRKCSCSKSRSITCVEEACPADPICKHGESLMKQKKTNSSCCDVFACVKASPLCAELEEIPKCSEGEVAKVQMTKSACPKYMCECDVFLCPPVAWPSNLEAGEVSKLVTNGCCPKIDISCNTELCSKKLQCEKGFEVSEAPGKCCKTYKCRPRSDICTYTMHYLVHEGVESRQEPFDSEPLTFELGETWQDGLCENCSCIDNQGQLVPHCTREQCPRLESMPESKDYDLHEIFKPFNCCPDVFRMRCKDEHGDFYLPDEEWQSVDNSCIRFSCELSQLGDVQKVKKIIECPKCPETSSYIPPSKKLGQCCGICRPSKCEENGEIHPVGDVWHPKNDPCRTAECVSEWGSYIHVVYTKPSCPTIPADCPNDKIIQDEKGCCRVCNMTSEITCSPSGVAEEKTLGFFTYHDIHRGGLCKNEKAVADVTQCRGACHSEERYSLENEGFAGNCKCCRANATVKRTVTLHCPDRTYMRKQFLQPKTCHCTKCEPEKKTNRWAKPERLQEEDSVVQKPQPHSNWEQESINEDNSGFNQQKPVAQGFSEFGQQQQQEFDDIFSTNNAMRDTQAKDQFEPFGQIQQQPFENHEQESVQQEAHDDDFVVNVHQEADWDQHNWRTDSVNEDFELREKNLVTESSREFEQQQQSGETFHESSTMTEVHAPEQFQQEHENEEKHIQQQDHRKQQQSPYEQPQPYDEIQQSPFE